MDNIRVQIYEVQRPDEAEKLVSMGVDHVGSVILEEDNWKVPAVKDTVRVVADAGARNSLIPLFSSADTISRLLDYYRPDIIHFCEALPVHLPDRERLAAILAVQQTIKSRFPEIAAMRSIPVVPPEYEQDSAVEDWLAMFATVSDFYLTDTILAAGNQEAAGQPVSGFVGITGTPCNWEVVARLVAATPVPVILAGGIADDNVYEGIIQTRPAGVDSCTRTNQTDGRGGFRRFHKDLEKVARLVSEVRRAEQDLKEAG